MLINHTRLIQSAPLSRLCGGDVYLKLENEQVGGSFKIRGALSSLRALTPAELSNGVVASSAGNHGLGIAIAAEDMGVRATIFVPSTAPVIKRASIAAHGVRVEATQPNYDDAELAARAFARDTRATFISPCTGAALTAGQGTVAREILDDLPSTRTIMLGVGGGGLAKGVADHVRSRSSGVRVIGVQTEHTNAMSVAFQKGEAVSIPDLPTLADGLAGCVDDEMYRNGKMSLDVLVTVSEREVAEAIRWLFREEGIVAEGAGAVSIAALLAGTVKLQTFPAVVIITGGNIDADKHAAIISE